MSESKNLFTVDNIDQTYVACRSAILVSIFGKHIVHHSHASTPGRRSRARRRSSLPRIITKQRKNCRLSVLVDALVLL